MLLYRITLHFAANRCDNKYLLSIKIDARAYSKRLFLAGESLFFSRISAKTAIFSQ